MTDIPSLKNLKLLIIWQCVSVVIRCQVCFHCGVCRIDHHVKFNCFTIYETLHCCVCCHSGWVEWGGPLVFRDGHDAPTKIQWKGLAFLEWTMNALPLLWVSKTANMRKTGHDTPTKIRQKGAAFLEWTMNALSLLRVSKIAKIRKTGMFLIAWSGNSYSGTINLSK